MKITTIIKDYLSVVVEGLFTPFWSLVSAYVASA